MRSYVLRPDWIVPVDRPPLRDSAIVVSNHRIESIGAQIPNEFRHYEVIRLAGSAVLPGLINSHCHLEFSDLTEPLPALDSFAHWLRSVVQYRRNQATNTNSLTAQRQAAIRSGIAESYRSGVRWIVDMVTCPWDLSWCNPSVTNRYPAASWLTVQPCYELIDLQPERRHETQGFASEHLHVASSGLAPHAPYTASIECTRWATEGITTPDTLMVKTPPKLVSMHLAESIEEVQWLQNRSGPIQDILGPFHSSSFLSHVGSIEDHCTQLSRASRALVVHGNHLPLKALRCISENRNTMAVVHCPRTHFHFRRDPFPWNDMRQFDIQVFLGTDSRASTPDLMLWRDIQTLTQLYPDRDPTDFLAMATILPARFLETGNVAGKIDVGCAPNLSVVEFDSRGMPADASSGDLLRKLFQSQVIPRPLEEFLTAPDENRSSQP